MHEPAIVTQKRLTGKVRQLKEIAEGLAGTGQSAQPIHDMMEVFTAHMKKGQTDQAEKLIDATLKKLRGETPPAEGAKIDPDAIKSEIEAMRVKDVAWRQIEWKTCLLDGLKASREQKKPLVLWVFIDRPVDDKRC